MSRPSASEDRATYAFLAALEQGAAQIAGSEARTIPGEDQWFPPTTLAGVVVTPEQALTLTAAFCAINVLSSDSSTLDLSCYRHTPDGGKQLAPENPVHELVHTTPDEEIPAQRFRQTLMGHVLGWGNGYARIYRKGNGTPYRLNLLSPKTTKAIRVNQVNNTGGVLAYSTDGGDTVIPASDVIHVAGLGFDGLVGYSPPFMARQAIALGLAAEAFGATFFGNNAHASGFLRTPRKLKPEAVMNLRDSLNSIHQGPYNAHKIAVLEEGMEWVQNSVNPEDAQFLASRAFQVLEIARIYRVPPHKLMDYSQAHLANLEESNVDYLMTSLLPWLVRIEGEFNLKLFTRAQRQVFFLEHSFETFLRGNMTALADYINKLFLVGAMSINEIRRMLRLNPIGPEGDKRYVPLNITPVDGAGGPSPAPAAAA